ncbi:hypothetical protein OAL26_01030 [Flavobacteriales bacterium]|nr:hypothetical protein [Flavobacteriales bacterium]
MKTFFKAHTLIFIYLIVFIILLNGVLIYSRTKYLPELSLFIFPLFIFYFGLSYLFKKKKISLLKPLEKWKEKLPVNLELIMVGICIALIMSHLISLGGSPAIKGISMYESGAIAELRRSITAESSAFWGYSSSFNIKAILPFTLLLSLFKKKKYLFTALFILGSFYAFSLLQKSYILTVLLPVFIYLLLNKKFIQSFGVILTCAVVVVSLVFVTNPQLRGGIDTITKIELEDPSDAPYYVRILYGIQHRMFEVPGEMVVEWFEAIPEKKPFLNGAGYNFITKLTSLKHRNYAKELYPIIRPQYAERGFKGSVNTATFMYEYSNFGNIGLVLSALLLSIIFIITESVFQSNFLMKISLNFFPIFMLSSGALTTSLFSNGWGPVILLYFIFANNLQKKHE